MTTEASAEKRRWVAAIAAGVVATVLLAGLFRAPPSAARPAPAVKPTIVLAPTDPLLKEEMALHDRAPLFLPTEWNSRPAPPRRDPGVAFASYPPDLRFAVDGLPLSLLPNDVPARPADELVDNPPGNPLLGLGQTDAPVPVLAPRAAFVEIAAAGTGAPVLSGVLAGAHPPEGVLWRPLAFIAAVDAAGLVGRLVLAEPSDVDAINVYFERFLTQTFRVGKRLDPGFYVIRVGQ